MLKANFKQVLRFKKTNMAKNYKTKGNSAQRYGLTQNTRILKALDPDYVQLDDRKIEHLLSYISEFASSIPFYNVNNEEEGTWEDLFIKDISVVLARIITTRTDLLNASFEKKLKNFRLASNYEEKLKEFQLLGEIVFSIPSFFDLWLNQIQNTNIPVKKFESNVEGELINIILEKVVPPTKKLVFYQTLIQKELGIDLNWDFNKFSKIWSIYEGDTIQENIYLGGDEKGKLETISLNLRLVFKEFHHILFYTINHLKVYFDKSLWNKSNHSPEIGLYLSYLKLFKFIQKDYNLFSSRFLNTYYSKILQQQKLSAIPDKVFVSLELGKSYDSFNLKKGITFSAGYDDDSNETLFKNNRDTYLSNIKLTDVKSIYVSNKKTGAGKGTNYQIINDVYATSSNGLIESLNEEIPIYKLPRIPLFGEDQEDKPERIRNMNGGDLGFAIASPLFYLEEGHREINVSLSFEGTSSITFKKLFVDLYLSLKTDDRDELSFEEYFYILFHNNNDDRQDKGFTTYYSSKDSWEKIPSKSVVITTSKNPSDWEYDGNIDNPENLRALNSLNFKLTLDASQAAMRAFSPSIDDQLYNTNLPVLKFILSSESQPFVYSFLKNLQVSAVNIGTNVRDLSNIDIYSDLGLVDTRYPFKGFGNDPYDGSFMVLKHQELFQKPIYELSLQIQWSNIPETVGAFKKYFQGYGKSFNPEDYTFNLSVLKDGDFVRLNHENGNVSRNIFSLESSNPDDDYGLNDFTLTLELDPNHSNIEIEDELEDDSYSINSKNGYIKIELNGPTEMFGHEMYMELYAQVMANNAQNDEKKVVPKKPLTPIIKSVSVAYKSNFDSRNTDIDFNFYHIHPYGLDKVVNDGKKRDASFLPNYSEDGYLFIGFTNITPPEPISLWFQLIPNSHSFWNAEPTKVNWKYLANNKWHDFNEEDVLYDGTDNFTKSGIIQLNIPTNITDRNTIFERGKYWIQASAEGNLELFCDAIKIIPNAIELERVLAEKNSIFEHIEPQSIISIVDKVPQIKSIYQPFASFSGRSAENEKEFFCRISELINHKNLAITHKDIERLVLGKFPEIFQIKAISDLSDPYEEEKYSNLSKDKKGKVTKLTAYQESILKLWKEGVLLVVIPKMKNVIHKAFPRFNYKYLQKVNAFIENKITPFAKCKVINPQLEYIRVICSVKFVEGKNNGLSIQSLKKEINTFIAPWLYRDDTVLKLGGSFQQQTLLQFIKGLEYVKFVTKLSILHIVEENGRFRIGDTAELKNELPILESMAWGVFVPDWDHEIELLDKEIEIEPENVLDKGMVIFQNRTNITTSNKSVPIRIKTKKQNQEEEIVEETEYELTIKI